VPYTASALARTSSGTWRGQDLDLSAVDDVDGLIDLLTEDLAADGASDSAVVLFLEEDDEYLLIARTNGDDDTRLFVSDRRVLEGPGLAGRIVGDELAVPEPADDEEEESSRPEVEPAGDVELLADLGIAGSALLDLCAQEGNLPADVIFAVCEQLGCADVLEAVRGV
jgi:putative tRNA adenosine deaminase-associated protein